MLAATWLPPLSQAGLAAASRATATSEIILLLHIIVDAVYKTSLGSPPAVKPPRATMSNSVQKLIRTTATRLRAAIDLLLPRALPALRDSKRHRQTRQGLA